MSHVLRKPVCGDLRPGKTQTDLFSYTGWLGWAMVLGSFQCRGVLLLLHIVGQGPAVLAAGAGWVGYIVFIFFIYFTFLMSCLLGDGWTWLKYCSFGCETPTVVVSYCRGRPRLVLVNRLEGLSLPRNSTTINWPARHDLVVDWAVKPQHKQTNYSATKTCKTRGILDIATGITLSRPQIFCSHMALTGFLMMWFIWAVGVF